MTRLLFTLLCMAWLIGPALAQDKDEIKAQAQILREVQRDVIYLADDKLKGRETGTEGEQLAAEYIAKRFKEVGLTPKGDLDANQQPTWFQEFEGKPENPHGHGSGKSPHGSSPHGNGHGHDHNGHNHGPSDPFLGLAHPLVAVPKGVIGKNVIGYLDNKAATTVVIGAHYDHLGMGMEGSLHAGDAEVHNGADDNASGVAALVQLARLLRGKHTNNNYLFIAFSGEEKGLWGSNFYCKNPTIDLKTVNYMLNMDMVGRMQGNKLAINGVGTSPVWMPELEKLAKKRLELKTTESGVGPSDHTSFYLNDIPVLHFFTGQHEDYHKPTDDADKVNFRGIVTVTNFMMDLVAALNDDGKLAFSKTKDEDSKKAPKFSVTLGVMPDYMYSGNGMRIDGIIDDRPAQKANLQKGDVVTKMGDVEVTDMRSYMTGLSKFKKGDKTMVTILRDGKPMEVEVEF